jgi:AbrB family looped-hinge helix DNA binding protein
LSENQKLKKFPKIVQCDSRGQIVIPKDMRSELGIDEGTGFWMYSITDEGILLKKVEAPELQKNKEIIDALEKKSSKIGVKKKNIAKAKKAYKKTTKGRLELI